MIETNHISPLNARPYGVYGSADRSLLFAILICMALCLVFRPAQVQAQLSPGDLSAPHAELEGLTNCTKCHEFGEGPSAQKCLQCHTGISATIKAEKGYHFQVVTKERKACFSCHSDHSGKEFELIHWEDEMKRFDHQKTSFALTGKHEQVDCRGCHKADFLQTAFLQEHDLVDLSKTFLGLTENCLGCHHDEHRGQLDSDCKKCHSTDHWTPARGFDHKATKFELKGKHFTTQCQKCHPTQRDKVAISPAGVFDSSFAKFTGLDFKSCVPCHTDPHVGKLGKDCLKCHSQDAWSPASGFDHNSTGFPLTGKHKKAKCESCHKNIGTQSPKIKKSAKPSDVFASYKGLSYATCESCHTDVHKAKLGADCQSCHKTNGWSDLKQGSFNHSSTEFPLRGKHLAVKCQGCHKSGVTKAKELKSEFCADCHQDIHKGQFAKRKDQGMCESCHTENGFTPSQFTIKRHNDESAFKLTGAHLAQPCPICHVTQKDKRGDKVMLFHFEDTNCLSCHSDIHLGQFTKSTPEKTCVSCHLTDSWSELHFDHNRDATYKLEGAHAQTLCAKCHKSEKQDSKSFVRYRPVDSACKNCHSMKTLEFIGKP